MGGGFLVATVTARALTPVIMVAMVTGPDTHFWGVILSWWVVMSDTDAKYQYFRYWCHCYWYQYLEMSIDL